MVNNSSLVRKIITNLFWFCLLSAWIVLLSVSTQYVFSPTVSQQSNAVYDCIRHNVKDTENIKKYSLAFFQKNGMGLTVMIESNDTVNLRSYICLFDSDGKLRFSVP